jgi:hypothetical protein
MIKELRAFLHTRKTGKSQKEKNGTTRFDRIYWRNRDDDFGRVNVQPLRAETGEQADSWNKFLRPSEN